MTKIRIDLQSGLLEVEGGEDFVKTVYQDYKDELSRCMAQYKEQLQGNPAKLVRSPGQSPGQSPGKTQTSPSKRGSGSRKARESFSIAKDLDLSSNGGKKSLRDFYKEKGPNTAMENNVVFVYYLQKISGVSKIDPSYVYSCYKDVGARVPTALKQSLLDTSHRKGWIDTASLEDLKVATQGENFVEQDLPHPDLSNG